MACSRVTFFYKYYALSSWVNVLENVLENEIIFNFFTKLGSFRNPCSMLLNGNVNLITERLHNSGGWGGGEAIEIG